MDRIPRLIVFDLDLTLWPLHVDECVTPFTKNSSQNDCVIDSSGRICSPYTDTFRILSFLKEKNYTLACASRAKNICGSYQLLRLFGIADFFRYKEVYPGSKVHHFNVLKNKSNIPFEDMLFFDNDQRNLKPVGRLGVTSVLVDKEITLEFVLSALKRMTTRVL